MILIYAILHDGVKTLLTKTTNTNFDIQKWANSRREAFCILGIVAIEYEVI